MSARSIIKNILPYYFTSKFINGKKKPRPQYFDYIEKGDSILLENFVITTNSLRSIKCVRIGDDNMLDCKIIIESADGQVLVGNRTFIGCSTIICRTKIEFGNNIFVAWGVTFYDHDSHSIDFKYRQLDIKQQLEDYRKGFSFIKNKNWAVVNSSPIKICDNAWIGMNAIILKGVEIGEGAIVAAGSVVTKNVDPWTMVAGNPARLVRQLEK
jgi:acetyltransferase-like isoleucine patch superfamily enzyme